MSLHPKRSRDPTLTGRLSGDRVGTWQPGSRPSGVRPAQARSRRASRCPRCRDELPSELPVSLAPAPCRPQLCLLLSQPLHRCPTPQNPPAGSNETTHLSPCPPRNGHGTLLPPTSCCPTPRCGSRHIQWGQGLGRGATRTVSPGQRQGKPPLVFHCRFPVPDALLSAKTERDGVSSPTGPCRKGGPLGCTPSLPWVPGRGHPVPSPIAEVKEGQKLLPRGLAASLFHAPSWERGSKFPLPPCHASHFIPPAHFGASLTPPGEDQGLLQGDLAAL